MICQNCGAEFEGNFCQNCGIPAPQKTVCENCGQEFTGNFCPNCGLEAPLQMDVICRDLYDIEGNYIDVDQLAGVYLSVSELRGYFRRNTDYTDDEIEMLAEYIYNEIDGDDIGILESVSVKARFESPGKRARSELSASRRGLQPEKQRPMTKWERIRENKKNGVACCPKCGSTSISANKKGFSFVKGGIGGGIGSMIPGVGFVVGLGAGNIGSKKLIVTCLNCGHKWKL